MFSQEKGRERSALFENDSTTHHRQELVVRGSASGGTVKMSCDKIARNYAVNNSPFPPILLLDLSRFVTSLRPEPQHRTQIACALAAASDEPDTHAPTCACNTVLRSRRRCRRVCRRWNHRSRAGNARRSFLQE
jgi:streptomycin 6-kinase